MWNSKYIKQIFITIVFYLQYLFLFMQLLSKNNTHIILQQTGYHKKH